MPVKAELTSPSVPLFLCALLTDQQVARVAGLSRQHEDEDCSDEYEYDAVGDAPGKESFHSAAPQCTKRGRWPNRRASCSVPLTGHRVPGCHVSGQGVSSRTS